MKGIKGTSIVIGTSDTVGSPGIEKIDTSLSSGSSFVSRLGSVHSGYVVRARQWPETIYFVTAGNDNFARIWDYTGNPMTSFNQISEQAFNWEGLDTDHYSDSFVKGSLTLGSKHAVLVKIQAPFGTVRAYVHSTSSVAKSILYFQHTHFFLAGFTSDSRTVLYDDRVAGEVENYVHSASIAI
jgi:hypothetical protein